MYMVIAETAPGMDLIDAFSGNRRSSEAGMKNTVVAIDDHFNSRMIRTDTLGAAKSRPVNPFANRSFHDSASLRAERSMAPEVSAYTKVGAVYSEAGVGGTVERVVDTKEEQYIMLDQRNNTHPSSGTRLHTTLKLPTDSTREK